MKNGRSRHYRHLVGLELILIGLMIGNVLPIRSSHQTAHAAVRSNPTKFADGKVSNAVANGKIAFARFASDGTSGIYTMNPDGSEVRRLTFDGSYDSAPAWSRDGTKIAFVKGNTSSYPYKLGEIFVMNADGSNQTRLTTGRNDNFPAWSPDGTKIAFSQDPFFRSSIYVMNADGSDQRKILDDNYPSFAFCQPAWSPDGSRLAFTDGGGILVINASGGKPIYITGRGNNDFKPSWSPDGSEIVFERWLDCDIDYLCDGSQIWGVNADGGNPAEIAGANVFNDAFNPTWSPDGTKILFSNGDLFVMNPDVSGLTNITKTPDVQEEAPSWQPLPFAPPPAGNPIDDAQFFVRQNYRDLLNREADGDGLTFWTNEIALCGSDAQCVETKRTNVSAAYFLSIEFQQTGYLVERIYKAAYGNLANAPVPIRLNEFLPDTKEIGQGVIVNQAGWEQVLDNNKRAFASEFVQRSRFTSAYPTSMTPAEFVDQLFMNAGVTPPSTDRADAISEFGPATTTSDTQARGRALRRVAENSTLVQQEFNRAFVLMQYFGYLRRNPNDPPELSLDFQGYNFWLNKLNSFYGNFISADIIKAFITSTEYRQRFGPS